MILFTPPKWRGLFAALFLAALTSLSAADLDALRAAARSGDEMATRTLIAILDRGDAQAQREALSWYTTLARAGDLDAALNCAYLYAKGEPAIGLEADPAQAEELYYLALKKSDEALIDVINFYNNQRPPQPHYDQFALERLRKYANDGNGSAQALLAQTYVFGVIVPQDNAAGLAWLNKAVAQGSEEARLLYASFQFEGTVLPKDLAGGMKTLTEVADAGSVKAQYHAGIYYRDGTYGRADPVLAAKYLKQAADADHRGAQLAYAKLQQSGTGVAKDPAAAFATWLKLAKDEIEADYQLGLAYRDGNGTAKDLTKAAEHLRYAAADGHAEAQAALPAVERLVPVKYEVVNAFLLRGADALREKDRYVQTYSHRGKAGEEVTIEVYGRTLGFDLRRTDASHLRLFVDDGSGKFEAVSGHECTVRLKRDGHLQVKVSTANPGQEGDAVIAFSTARPTADGEPAALIHRDRQGEHPIAWRKPGTIW